MHNDSNHYNIQISMPNGLSQLGLQFNMKHFKALFFVFDCYKLMHLFLLPFALDLEAFNFVLYFTFIFTFLFSSLDHNFKLLFFFLNLAHTNILLDNLHMIKSNWKIFFKNNISSLLLNKISTS